MAKPAAQNFAAVILCFPHQVAALRNEWRCLDDACISSDLMPYSSPREAEAPRLGAVTTSEAEEDAAAKIANKPGTVTMALLLLSLLLPPT